MSWKDNNGSDCVRIFKTKLNANKQFDGFEDEKLAMQDNIGSDTWRGLVAVDLAAEGVELGTPVHLRKKSNRSYVAALNAIPYHVDNVNEEGTDLQKDPHNFTYSEAMNGGSMTVSYGKSTTNNQSNTVTQDLSQTVETMFIADPKGDNEKVQDIFGKVKGIAAITSAVSDMAAGNPKKSKLGWLKDAMEFITDKVDKIDQQANTEASTTTIDKNITATTHDAILYMDTARHLWRYPVMTRPLPMWLAGGSRVDSTPVSLQDLTGDRELYITFTMSENSALTTSSSLNDSLYQPLHEEGNFFSYPSQIGDVEGYNDAGILAEEDKWDFSSVLADTGMQHRTCSIPKRTLLRACSLQLHHSLTD